MTDHEVLQELQTLGTQQNRKVYKRHGVGDNFYGVSFADLGKLKKRIKVDHELAQSLWATGNHDARMLATMIADPLSVTPLLLETWAKGLDNYIITDALADLVSKTPLAREKAEQWSQSDDEWIGRAGWRLLAHLAMDCPELPDEYFEKRLQVIEGNVHSQKNRVRDAMNAALIAIGIRNPDLEKQALTVAGRIGKVVVDHGQTSCKTPDAAEYIHRTVARKRSSKAAVV